MLVYLDSVIVIYAIEGSPSFKARARLRLSSLGAVGDSAAVSDLTRLECLVKPIRLGDSALIADYERFFNAPDLIQLPLPSAVYERATHIRALHRYSLADSLHLAAAVVGSCGTFLTNDARLVGFPDIAVEVLA